MTKDEFLNINRNVKNRIMSIAYNMDSNNHYRESKGLNDIQRLYEQFKEEMTDVDSNLFKHLSIDDYLLIGCSWWDEELLLMPDWLLTVLPKGTEVIDIHGDKSIVGIDQLDMDVRMGVTAYGFTKQMFREHTLDEVMD